MIESTARAERFDLQTSKSPSYLWEVPQKPVAVRIPFNLMDRLEREAVEAFRSLSSRGSEIGGLLVGDVAAGNPLVVSIADYELISCDYARGPLYRLTEADMERFRRAMDQRKGGPGQTVAGFFRSHTRKGIALDADDLAFYEACFRDPHHIALLVRPFATKASTAGIFIWEGGKVHGDASYLEFPFRSSELGGHGSETAASEGKSPAPQAPPTSVPPPSKPTARAQIVPIASRRDIATAPEPLPVIAAPPPPPPPLMAAAPVAPPAAPKPEEKQAPAEQKGKAEEKSKVEDKGKLEDKGKFDKQPAKKDAGRPAEPAKAAGAAPAKPATPPTPAKAPEKITEKTVGKAADTALEPETAKSGKGMKLVLAAAATIALFVALFVYPGFLRHSTKTPANSQGDTSPLQLRVERSNGELLLTWNRDSDAIRNATKATLLIMDGEQHENVDMDLSQLRNNGSIVYSPSSSDVSFKMEVIGRDQSKTTSEQVRILRTRPSPLDTQQADAKPAAPAPAAPATKAPVANDKPAAPDQTADQTPAPEAPKPVTPRREFNTASLAQRIRPAQPNDIPDAPTVGGAVSAALPGVNLPAAGAVPNAPVPPPSTRPAAPTPAAPAPSTAAPQTQAPTIANLSKQGGQIQQAVLISRKEPEYPKIAKQTGAKGVVTLNATIGKDGHIKAVKVVSGHPMLQNAAVEAVKQWIYKPTLLNGTPVETETQIMLNFVGER